MKWLAGAGVGALVVLVIVLAVVLQPGEAGEAAHVGAIATDAAPCEQVGAKLLRAGGNAVDVTIGILFCEGVSSAQSMGLGGGFIMTIFNRKTKEAHVLNAREPAPADANADMFGDDAGRESVYGPKAVAVPAELKGYHEAHKRFGKLPWAELVKPTIQLCEEGVPVIQYVANILSYKRDKILQSPSLSALLVDPETGDVKKKGDLVKRTQLATTLRVVAEEGGLALHGGSLTDAFVSDMKAVGVNVTAEDLRKYEPRWSNASVAKLPRGLTLLSPPPPGSGPLLAHFLMLTADMVDGLRTAAQYQRVVEALKFVYAARSDFGDEAFEPSVRVKAAELVDQTFVDGIRAKIRDRDRATSTNPADYGASWSTTDPKGTAHVSVVTEDFAVSVTSTINTEYGSMIVTEKTGIILNNEMDDFSLPNVTSYYGVPPSEVNFIKPGKIPLSSMAPSIVLGEDGDVRLVIGASGGTRITSSVGLVSLMHLYLGMGLDEAIAMKRVHHQLMPMTVQCEIGFPPAIREGLTHFGHNTTDLSRTSSSVMAIEVRGNKYFPSADARREGVVALVAR